MPDLSFYPEPHMLDVAIANPVEFGISNKHEIAGLIDIADYSLGSFSRNKSKIQRALNSKNPWKRYWALVVCSSFGSDAATCFKKAKQLAENDTENLVRMRAIEFLALNKQDINIDNLLQIIRSAKTKTEANLILNSVALMKTQNPEFEIAIPRTYFDEAWIKKENDLVSRRIDFINK